MATRGSQQVLSISASSVARIHTILAFSAFLTALAFGCALHYKKIVKNGVAGYPQEWFPSVSATIGDWYPERNIFQILIALNAGPRFALVLLGYYLHSSNGWPWAQALCITGIIRTLSCGGWVYITSSDGHDVHDILMITYIVCNIPWMLGNIACTPKNSVKQRRKRIIFASTFFGTLPPMVFFFIRHKQLRIPGAYTHYSFFEWSLIFLDICFDGVMEADFSQAGLSIDITGAGTERRGPTNQSMEKHTHQEEGQTDSKELISLKSPMKTDMRRLQATSLIRVIFRSPRVLFSYMSDIYLSFMFFSIYTSLMPSLFYFSVWELGITGSELALLTILSPGLLGFSSFKNWAATRPGRTILHMLSLAGLIAYKSNSPFERLVLVAFACGIVCIGTVIDWSGLGDQSPVYSSIVTACGLTLTALSKHANHSNNPIWPMVNENSGGYNKSGIILAVLAIAEFGTRTPNETIEKRTPAMKTQTTSKSGTLLPTLIPAALGSLIFSLHCFLSDSSTLISWTWTGYPIQGPVPHLHGSFVLCAMSFGIFLSLLAPRAMLCSPTWFAFGATSSLILYYYNNWFGFVGGIGLAVFLVSLVPQTIILAAETKNVGRTYFFAFFVAILLYLANVWTVAYAFVPGGKYLRERSDLVLAVEILLLAPAFDWSGRSGLEKSSFPDMPKRLRQYIYATIAFVAIISGLVSLYRTPTVLPQPFKPGPRIVRAGVWTVHFGMDNEGRDSQRAMATLLKDMELDIVGLLETDLHRVVYGNRDLTRVLQEEVGYYVDLGPGPNLHTWGAVLLSKFPIINSTHHLLPSPHGELAPAITAYLDIWGTEVLVVVAHNGQEEDPLDRELQSMELARIMNDAYPTPTIFLGYIVTKPHASRPAPYQIMQEDGKVFDIEEDDLERWCEYIFYRGLYRTSYLRMSRGKVTDTELQVGQFVLPRFGHSVTDESKEARNIHIHKEVLDENHWFPMEYYGNEHEGGKNGHYYHVFMTPLYYDIPHGAVL